MTGLPFLMSAVFPALTIIAALKDVTSFTIPNWISAALVVAFAPAAVICGLGWHDAGMAAAVGVGGLVLGMAMFAFGWIGGGDAKLMAACSLWLGFPAVMPFLLLVTALCGGGLALMLLALRSVWLRLLAMHGPAWVNRLATPDAAAPYGVAICAGALAAFPGGVISHAVALHL